VKDGGVGAYSQDFGEEAAALVHDAAPDVGEGVTKPVQPEPTPTVPHRLEGDQAEKDRDGQNNQVHVRK